MRGRHVIAAMFTLAALVWLAGVVINHPACRQCAVITPPPPDEETTTESNQPSPTVVSPFPRAARSHPDSATTPLMFSWDNTRDEILRSRASSAEKANQMLALLPLLSGEAQADAARHTANLLSDDHFLSAAACFTNANAPTNVQVIFMADLLNRPERVKLPLSLAVARDENHPCAAQAKDLLQLYLAEDFGANWPAWEAAMQARLRTNQ